MTLAKENAFIVYKPGYGYTIRLLVDAPSRPGLCTDCAHLVGRVNWWCGNAEAIKAHNTAIPNKTRCQFWKEAERLS